MAESLPPANAAKEKVKLALIPVLGLVLWSVLSDQDTSSTSPTTVVEVRSPSLATAHPTQQSLNSMGTSGPGQASWPHLPIEEIVARNPFAYPTEFVPTKPKMLASQAQTPEMDQDQITELTRRQKLLEEWQSAQPTAFYRSESGVVARIGSQVVREGDVIDGIIKIEKLGPEGVIFKLDHE